MKKAKRQVIEINLDENADTFFYIGVGTKQEQTALAELLSNEGLLEPLAEALKETLSSLLATRQSRARALLQNASQKRERPGLSNVLSPFSSPQLNGASGGEN